MVTLCKQIRHRECVDGSPTQQRALAAAYHMPWPYTKTALTCKPLLAQFGTS